MTFRFCPNTQSSGRLCFAGASLSEDELAVFRTKPCENKDCKDSERCPLSHCMTWQRRNPRLFNYSCALCPDIEFIKKGSKMTLLRKCNRGRSCQFAHSKEEELYHPLVYKTRICNAFPNCIRFFCPFAHTRDEFRVPRSELKGHSVRIRNERFFDPFSSLIAMLEAIPPPPSSPPPRTSESRQMCVTAHTCPERCTRDTTNRLTLYNPNDLHAKHMRVRDSNTPCYSQLDGLEISDLSPELLYDVIVLANQLIPSNSDPFSRPQDPCNLDTTECSQAMGNGFDHNISPDAHQLNVNSSSYSSSLVGSNECRKGPAHAPTSGLVTPHLQEKTVISKGSVLSVRNRWNSNRQRSRHQEMGSKRLPSRGSSSTRATTRRESSQGSNRCEALICGVSSLSAASGDGREYDVMWKEISDGLVRDS